MRRIMVLMTTMALLLVGAVSAGATTNDTSPLQDFGDQSLIGKGAFTALQRSADSVSVDIHSKGLDPGSAYTVWLVIFNNPSGCVAGCDGTDVIPGGPADVSVIWSGAGGVANAAGRLNVNGSLTEGNPEGNQQLFVDLGAPDAGFTDAEGAEIHTVVRNHGPATGNPDQVSTFEGDCTAASSADLGSGTFTCEDVQFSVHMP